MEVNEKFEPAPPLHPQVTTAHDEGEGEEGGSPLRRFRFVFLDRKQWCGQNRRIKRIWKEAESYKPLCVRGG